MTQPTKLSDGDRSLLLAYARGHDLADIAQSHKTNVDRVQAVLMRLTTMSRQRAKHLLKETDSPLVAPVFRAPAETPKVTVQSAAAEPAASDQPAASTLEGILAAGEKHTQPRVQALARKARSLLDTLREVIEEETRAAATRTRIAKLEVELAAARAQLPAGKKTAGKPGEAKQIRAWAAANGVDCPTHGVIPRRVVDAYHQAEKKGSEA